MERTGLLVHDDVIKGSGLNTLFLYSKLSADGTTAVVDVNNIRASPVLLASFCDCHLYFAEKSKH